jgi:hypothetical protein
MRSITTWNRMEPIPRSTRLTAGLRAEVADPLWLLTRQRQVGELSGEDAGSPIEAVAQVEVAPLARYHAGPARNGAARRAMDLSDSALPLETLVERRPVAGSAAEVRLAADGGAHLVRLLKAYGAEAAVGPWVAARPLDLASFRADAAGVTGQWLARHDGAVPDGFAVAADLRDELDADGSLARLPAQPALPAAVRPAALEAARQWWAWWRASVPEPADGDDAWSPARLEYGFAVGTEMSDGRVTLHADDYRGGHLDWWAFTADTRTDLGSAGAGHRRLVRRTLPSRAHYSGMPAERFWEFEDGTVRFGSVGHGRTELSHLLLDEFALTYGNDWFVVPLTLPVGSVAALRDLRVRDTFGREVVVQRTSRAGDGWRMFEISPRPRAAARAEGLVVVPAVLGQSVQGDPVEEVAWFRDELANLVWAVERRTETLDGRSQEHRYRGEDAPGTRRTLDADVGDAQLVYRLASSVPHHWFPLVPVRPAGSSPGALELRLQRLTRIAPDGTSLQVEPRGEFLSAADPLIVAEEEVGRDGVVTSRHWQLTRGPDGVTHLWRSNRSRVGGGEGSSGLVFDIARPVGP